MTNGRGFSAASASGSSFVSPPLTTGSGQFTPPPPTVPGSDPSSVPPPLAAGSGQCTPPPPPRVPGSGPSSVPPPLAAGASTVQEAEDVVNLQEGGGNFYDGILQEVWINGDKIEFAQASQFITKSIQAHFPRPIHRFNDFPIEVQELLYQMFMSNHRFTRPSNEAWSQSVWTTTARSNYKHLLYNARKNAQRICQSVDPTLWRKGTPTWMRRDYWEGLCNISAAERWQETSTTMKLNWAANPKANKHTSGFVSYATHQSRLESYSQQMIEKYAGEEEQPQLDPEVWVAASGAPKKGHVYGFGHSMDTSRVLSGTSSLGSQVTSAFTTPGAPGTSPNEMMGFI
ncbi:hypothetical protein Taro_001602 [Colocasia esculenta]|uniref:Uncharacterized protein n=1 Tax=Colocasia esculenta TaxID=4460 RepID=A0A843TIJ8_COLES|nr:hypothetical protein [Colocasia esculenta]